MQKYIAVILIVFLSSCAKSPVKPVKLVKPEPIPCDQRNIDERLNCDLNDGHTLNSDIKELNNDIKDIIDTPMYKD